MLCNFTCAVHLFNSEAQSVINNVAASRKKQNNYFFDIHVLIVFQKSICICGGFAPTADSGLQGGLPTFPYECKPRGLCWPGGFLFLSLFLNN